MSWVKLDDQFPTHPKIVAAGGDAAWLHVCALCYCATHLTDGMLPKGMVERISDRKAPRKLADKLVEVGAWVDNGDTYELHGYLDYNPSREHVENERRKAAERRANGGRASRERRPTNTNPDPTPPDVPTEHDGARKRAVRPPRDFEPTDEHRAYAGANGLNLPNEVVRWLTDCEAKGRTYKVVNAGFTTWLHHAVDFGRGGQPVASLEELAEPVRPAKPRGCPLNLCKGTGFVDIAGTKTAAPCRCRTMKANA